MYIYLPKSVRSIGRLRTIAQVLGTHGFEHLVQRVNLGRYVPLPGRWRRPRPLETQDPISVARRLVKVCEDLGPTFVKLGQVLSTRPDLLPDYVLVELRRLQDRVEPFSSDLARRVIEEDLGAPVERCFVQFDEAPMAAGSIAQAYGARTRDGRRVVVKVKRPGIESVIELDIQLLKWLADATERFIPEVGPFRPRMLIEEFEKTIRRELDFVNEAATMARFAEAFREDSNVRIADVIWELTGTRVLTMDYLEGLPLQQVIDAGDGRIDRSQLARTLSDAFLKQYFELGMFHGDPHPGNILIDEPLQVALIDFGMIGQLSEEMTGHFLTMLVAADNKEVDIVVDVLDDMEALPRQTDRRQLSRDLRELLEKYHGLPLKRLRLPTIFTELTEVVRANGVVLPRDLVMLGKSMVTIAGVGMQLDPDVNLLALIRPRVHKMILERFHPQRLMRAAGITGWHLLALARQMPRQLRDVTRRLARGQWEIHIRHQNLDYLASELDRSGNRLSFAIVIAAIIVSSSMILTGAGDATLLGLPIRAFGILGYVFAGILGAGLVWAIVRSGKLS
ncbi:MAG: AarF/ABC1/UbiB kinase family protein [Phycisphaerales bacterium]|nr:MAG: AarF/ABC1/UbiB kinase family protein [Phycisphaerales bacterium]